MKYLLMIAILAFGCGKDDDNGEVTVKQEPAVAGEPGTAGEDGKDGKDGSVEEIEAREDSGQNLWIDPITGFTWLIGGSGQWVDSSYCSGEFLSPTRTILITASLHGLLVVAKDMGADDTAWTKEAASVANGYIVNLAVTGYTESKSKGDFHGIYCYKAE